MHMHRKILIIDDEPVTRQLLSSVLEQANYEVVVAEDGLSGIEMARREKPALVITDGLLPKLHGFLVCKAIKEFDSPPKVIILTGLYTKPTYKWTVKHDYGADDLQVKPITPADLLACVEKHLADLTCLDLPDPVGLSIEDENHWLSPGLKGDVAPHLEAGVGFSDSVEEASRDGRFRLVVVDEIRQRSLVN